MAQLAALMGGRVVRCAFCRTDEYAFSEFPLSEGHVSVHWRSNAQLAGRVTVYLDGVDVTKDCYEAMPGENGFVVLYARDTFKSRIPCKGGLHAIAEKHWGRVVVKRRG